jgi:hypothetical protein
MKVFIILFIFVLVVLAGVFGYNALIASSHRTTSQVPVNSEQKITLTGTIQKASTSTGDFTHLIITSSGTKGINSNTVNLDDYVGQKVTVEGQNSGTTLFVDTIL